MHVCVLSDGYPPWEDGGAQKVAAQLATGYRDRGHDVSVVTTVAEPGETDVGTVDGVAVHRLHTPKPEPLLPYLTVHNPFVAGDVGRALDRVAPDAVHAHNAHWLSNASLRAAGERDLPVVKTFHDAGTVSYGEHTHVAENVPMDSPGSAASAVGEGGTPPAPTPTAAYEVDPWRQLREQGPRYNPLRNRLNRRALDRHVDVGVAVSDALRRALRANGVPCHEVIHNGVDACAFEGVEEGSTFRREHGLGDAPFALFGGRTGYNKGGAHLALAFARACSASDRGREPRLVVTGDDSYVDRMREVAGPHGDGIVTMGWVDRRTLRVALSAATVVATPSVHLDPFPTLNLEALAAGTPVVTTRFGGARELVDHGEDGLVVDPRDVDALAEALGRYLCDSDRAEADGAAGQEKVREGFTVERQVDAYEELLERVRSGD